MKGIRIEGKNGAYKVIAVELSYDKNGEIDCEEDVWLFNDNVDKLYLVEYNGKMYCPFSSMEEIEEEFDDKVVDALKRDGYFHEVEYCDDPDDDDEVWDIRLFVFHI